MITIGVIFGGELLSRETSYGEQVPGGCCLPIRKGRAVQSASAPEHRGSNDPWYQCALAIPYLDRADRILPDSYFVHSIRGRALACLGRLDEALAHFEIAARIQPGSDIYQWMGLALGQMGRISEAGVSLRKAVTLGPESAAAHGSLGLWYESVGDFRSADGYT